MKFQKVHFALFILFIKTIEMHSPNAYVEHPLNTSPTKEAHSFSKATRFQKARRLYFAFYEGPQRQSTTFLPLQPRGLLLLELEKKAFLLIEESCHRPERID